MMPQGIPLPSNVEDLEFETAEENWNEYDLPNQVKVKGRIIITRFYMDKNNPNPNAIGVSGQNIFVVSAPQEQRGAPSPLTLEEIQRTDYPRVNVITVNEKWNKYKIVRTGMGFKIKLVLNEVYRVNGRYDNDGMPSYLFNAAPMILPDKHVDSSIRP